MNLTDVISPVLADELAETRVVGIDIGSRAAKGVLLDKGRLFTALIPTGGGTVCRDADRPGGHQLYRGNGIRPDRD